MKVSVLRLTDNPTFGVMSFDGTPMLATLELPWKDNQHDISCIPEGIYVCERRPVSKEKTGGIGYSFEVKNVPNRSDVLIHVGNKVENTLGCILVALMFGNRTEDKAIRGSVAGFQIFLTLTKNINSFVLEITRHV